tara:strand:- start:6916 stop:7341 length:426 start_codon:yes stop_codon:yes gene_type:complete
LRKRHRHGRHRNLRFVAVAIRPHFADVAHALDRAPQTALNAWGIARHFTTRHVTFLHIDQFRLAALRLVVHLRRLRLRDMDRAPGKNRAACGSSGELCNGQTYRHEQSLPAYWERPKRMICDRPPVCCCNRDPQILYRQLN